MKIVHCETVTEAITGPMIEVRDTGGGVFMLSVALSDDESLLTGPFPSAATAEAHGIEEAARRGFDTLNVVHTPARRMG